MPSGRVHEAINTGVLGLAAALIWATGPALTPAWLEPGSPLLLIAAAGYLTGTFLVTPDLDLADQHVSAKRNWGILGVLWVPYGKASRHRGLSHSYLTGAVIRLLYLAVLLGALWALLNVTGVDMPDVGWPMAAAFAAGYFPSQWLHLLADGIMPWDALLTAPGGRSRARYASVKKQPPADRASLQGRSRKRGQ